MSGTPPPSPGGAAQQCSSGLRALSGSLSLSAAAAAALAAAGPSLRSELSQQHHQQPLLAPFGMRSLDPTASLELFKRMRGGGPPASAG